MRYFSLLIIICCISSCRSTDTLLSEPQKERALYQLKNDLLGYWEVEGNRAKAPLNKFKFSFNERDEFEMHINDRIVQITNFEIIGPLDFSIAFKGLDYTELFLFGKFKSFNKNVLLLINSDEENNNYETIQKIRLVKR